MICLVQRASEKTNKYLSSTIHRFKNVTNAYVQTKCNNKSSTF